MKVIEHLTSSNKPLISFEIIPPRRGGDIKTLLNLVDDLAKFNPPFIDITSHAAEVIYEETPHGLKRKSQRKRPGTLGICALIQKKYNIDAVPHMLCLGFTREETEDFLIDLQYLEIENVFAVRGDSPIYKKPIPSGRTANKYASELVSQVIEMNTGKYLEDDLLDAKASNFCIGVGGYPEKHFEAPNLESDIANLKTKVDAGASYIVTQMFFDNQAFYKFEAKCREAGITVPIIPGLKIITKRSNLTSIPRNLYINMPVELTNAIANAPDNQVAETGVDWTLRQVEDLLAHGVPSIHFYIMQSSKIISKLLNQINL